MSAWRIGMILIGVMIALPAFVMGAELSHSLGATDAILASFLGGALLASIAVLGGVAGARSRLSTYMLIIDAFGSKGARVANGLLGITILGWFGVVAMMFGRALLETGFGGLARIPLELIVIFGCALVILTTIVGFRGLDLLSMIVTPLKLGLLLWTFFAAAGASMKEVWAFSAPAPITLGTGISIVAGGLMVGATLAPDVCRFARSSLGAALACGGAYAVCFPLILLLSGFPSLVTGEKDLVVIMLALGLGVPAMLVVVLTAWSTNAFNLYSAALVLATLRPRQPRWQLVVGIGIAGGACGLAGISDKLIPFLVALSIAIPPIAGVYLMNYYCKGLWGTQAPCRSWRPEAFIAWAAGISAAVVMNRYGVGLTPVRAIDAIAVSGVVYFTLRTGMARRSSTVL